MEYFPKFSDFFLFPDKIKVSEMLQIVFKSTENIIKILPVAYCNINTNIFNAEVLE